MTAAIRLGVSFDGSDPPQMLRAITETADSNGAANLWLASHLFHREPIACAAAALAMSRNLGIVLMAMSPYTVHPVYSTMAAATLDEYFPGRVQLCFGVGAPRDLEAAGIAAEHPLQTVREALEIARSLLAGETISFSGRRYKVSGRRLLMGERRVPLWIAASGPRMLELAGEKADGVVISAGSSPAFVRWSLESVRRGEERSGRKVQKAGLVLCSVDRDEARANNRLRRSLAYILRGQHHARNLQLAGSTLDQVALATAFGRQDWNHVDSLITDEILRRHCVNGTPAQARQALSAYRTAGLDEIVIYGVHKPPQVTDILASLQSSKAVPPLE